MFALRCRGYGKIYFHTRPRACTAACAYAIMVVPFHQGQPGAPDKSTGAVYVSGNTRLQGPLVGMSLHTPLGGIFARWIRNRTINDIASGDGLWIQWACEVTISWEVKRPKGK